MFGLLRSTYIPQAVDRTPQNRQLLTMHIYNSVVSRFFFIFTVLFTSLVPQTAMADGIDAAIDNAVQPLTDAISSFIFFAVKIGGTDVPLIVCWLIFAACFFTFYLGFINLRGFKHAVDIVRGKFTDPNHAGEISHFQALTAAVSGTVGIGNIGAVAITVSLGGPGAIFWVAMAGFVGMTTKFVECTLGVKYRQINADGSVSGGPMYYLRDGLKAKGCTAWVSFSVYFMRSVLSSAALALGICFNQTKPMCSC